MCPFQPPHASSQDSHGNRQITITLRSCSALSFSLPIGVARIQIQTPTHLRQPWVSSQQDWADAYAVTFCQQLNLSEWTQPEDTNRELKLPFRGFGEPVLTAAHIIGA